MCQRARILQTKAKGYPAEDVLRFVQPKYYLPVLREAANAYTSQSSCGGLEFADILRGKSDKPRATAPWEARVRLAVSTDTPASDRAAGALEEVLNVAEGIDPVRHAAVFKRRILGFRPQR